MIYAEFGIDAISKDYSSTGKNFSGYVDIAILKQIGLLKIALKFSQYLILLLVCQSVPAFIYGCFVSLKNRRKAALAIWLLPSLSGLLTRSLEGVFGYMLIYLFSPFSAIITFPGFIFFEFSGTSEDSILYQFAIIGWFHIFWFGITIKGWLFPD